MTKLQQDLNLLIETFSDKDFFLCETGAQARAMSEGFVQMAKGLQGMVEKLERGVVVQYRRYGELLAHKDELAKEVQCARMYLENMNSSEK